MFQSILDDIKYNFKMGNTVTRIIILNVVIFVIAALIVAFSGMGPGQKGSIELFMENNFFISALPQIFILKPWTLITYMFMHVSFMHILWNMIGLNMFGTIMGDLLNDRRIMPLYILGGIVGAICYMVAFRFSNGMMGSPMLGASASIMAIAAATGLVAPDYNIKLLLIGNVKLKYIVLAFVFFDIIGTQGASNTGGHFAHLGGLGLGFLFAVILKNGTDITLPLQKLFSWLSTTGEFNLPLKNRTVMKVKHRSERLGPKGKMDDQEFDPERLNRILEKIKVAGYNNLSAEEKDFLNKASRE